MVLNVDIYRTIRYRCRPPGGCHRPPINHPDHQHDVAPKPHTNQHTHSVVADRRRRAFLTASRGGDGTSASDTIKKMTKEEPEDQTATYSQANGRNAKKPNIEVGAPEEVLPSSSCKNNNDNDDNRIAADTGTTNDGSSITISERRDSLDISVKGDTNNTQDISNNDEVIIMQHGIPIISDQPTVEQSIPPAHQGEIPSQKSAQNNDTSTQCSNNTSISSVLGNDSDKQDYCKGPPSRATSSRVEKEGISEEENGSGTAALNKLKQFFGAKSSSGRPTEDASDYQNFASPNRVDSSSSSMNRNNAQENERIRSISLNNTNGYDESLLNEEEKGQWTNEERGDVELCNAKDPTKRRAWGKPNTTQHATTEEEERVMGECSFFYNNHDETMNPSHRIPGTESQTNNEEDDERYFEEQPNNVHNYKTQRLINPRAMANAIKTRAKRQWTERRYRRRLNQSSQLETTPYGLYESNHGNNNSQRLNNGDSSNQSLSYSQQRRRHQVVNEFQYELTTEHRHAFQVAHAALNGKIANEYGRNRHAIRKQYGYDDYDVEYDLELAQEDADARSPGGGEEIRADLTKSSLAIRGGQIRLPTDNVRLVCDPQLQPGILSIETRDVGVGGGKGVVGYENYGNANRYGNIHGSGMIHKKGKARTKKKGNDDAPRHDSSQQWTRQELAYILTVDEHIYRGIVREMGDAYRMPCGMYYCFHVTEDGAHVGIGVAIMILLVIFLLLIICMIAWPTW